MTEQHTELHATAEFPTATIVDVIQFHGFPLMVYRINGGKYIYLKQFTDVLGLAWSAAKRSISTPEAKKFYGILNASPQKTTSSSYLGGTSTPQYGDQVDTGVHLKGSIFMKLEATQAFVFSLSPTNIRAKGNPETADLVYRLKDEWKKVLHDYDTKGYAGRSSEAAALRSVVTALKLRGTPLTEGEKAAITKVAHQQLAEIGIHVIEKPSPQLNLPIGE